MATKDRLEQALRNADAAGDAEAARAFANAIREGQFDDAPQEQSMLGKAGDLAAEGLNAYGNVALEGMAAVNRGATKLVDFAASLPNAAMQVAGIDAQIPSLTESVSEATAGNFMDQGLGRDIVRQGGEMIPGAVAMGGAIRQAASTLPGMAPAIEGTAAGALRQMGSSTAGQDAGFGVLSGVGQAVGQEIGGDTGAMLGGFLAPLAPIAAKGAFTSAMRSIFGADDTVAAARVIDDFASFGQTPTAGMASGKKGIQGAENISSRAMGGGPLAKKSEAIAESMQKRLASIADDISTKEGAETAGLEIQKGITGRGGFLDRFRSKSSVLWKGFDEKVNNDAVVDLANTKNKLSEIVRGGQIGGLLDNPKLTQIKQVLDNTEAVTYKDIRDLRSMIGQKIGNNELVSDIPRAELKQIYGALSEDIKAVAAASGDDALKAFKRANNFTRTGHQRIDDYLERIVTKVDPDKVYAAVTKGGEGTKTVNAFKKSLKPEEWEVVVSNVVRKLGRSTSGNQNAVGDDAAGEAFSVQKFVTDWDKLGPAKKALFSGSKKIESYGDDLAKIARSASVVKDASKVNANTSGTAQAASRIAAGTGVATGIVTASPTILAATAASVAMNNAGARLMSNPAFVKWLAHSAKIPASRSSAAISALVGVANQSSADDAAIIQQLTEELEND